MAGQKARPDASVDFNTDAWVRGLQAAVREVRLRTDGDLLRLALSIQNAARRYSPVDTGRLRSSIQASALKRDRRGSYVEVGTNVEYAPYVEFGTIRQAPQPFLRPAFLEAAQRMRRRP